MRTNGEVGKDGEALDLTTGPFWAQKLEVRRLAASKLAICPLHLSDLPFSPF
ncbi:hypothetical protein IV102_36705 [bacterium]|nr:hypothetical protein [bacterium]